MSALVGPEFRVLTATQKHRLVRLWRVLRRVLGGRLARVGERSASVLLLAVRIVLVLGVAFGGAIAVKRVTREMNAVFGWAPPAWSVGQAAALRDSAGMHWHAMR